MLLDRRGEAFGGLWNQRWRAQPGETGHLKEIRCMAESKRVCRPPKELVWRPWMLGGLRTSGGLQTEKGVLQFVVGCSVLFSDFHGQEQVNGGKVRQVTLQSIFGFEPYISSRLTGYSSSVGLGKEQRRSFHCRDCKS